MKQTDLNKVKEQSKILFDAVSFEDASDNGWEGFIISHPYTNCGINMTPDGKVMDLINNEDDQISFRNRIFERIDKAKQISSIVLLLNKPYLLYWFKIVSPFLSKEDFSKWLGEIWVMSENPNMDVNVPLKTVIKLFTQAELKDLMYEDEFKFYSALPDEMTVYRGVSRNRNPKGLSYTLDIDKAIWFQNRFANEENTGSLIERRIKKSDILAYFNRRGEDEIVLNTLSL